MSMSVCLPGLPRVCPLYARCQASACPGSRVCEAAQPPCAKCQGSA